MWYVCDRQAQWIGVQGQYLSCDFFSSIDLWAKESDTKIKQGGGMKTLWTDQLQIQQD